MATLSTTELLRQLSERLTKEKPERKKKPTERERINYYKGLIK